MVFVPRELTYTPAQYRTTMQIATYRPFSARLGWMTYAKVDAT